MFTGIIETQAELLSVETHGSNKTFRFRADLASEFRVDQSVSHNGVCLTVESIEADTYSVTAIAETLTITNLGQLQPGNLVNLERCMPANGRFDGHIVQGHVDQTGTLIEISDLNGSYLLGITYRSQSGNITVPKGSICINGISLTVVTAADGYFSVAIIPYTWANTNLRLLKLGQQVNLEFDILGKYIQKIMTLPASR